MGKRYILVEDNDSSGCALLLVGGILLLCALPVFFVWRFLFCDFKKRYNYLKYSLSKFTRLVLLAWALVGYGSYIYYVFQSVAGSYMTVEQQQELQFIARYGACVYSAIALVLIIASTFYYRRENKNPWSGTDNKQLRSKSVARAIGWSVVIFLTTWIIIGLLGVALELWLLPLLIAVVSYFVIENFL